MAEQTTFHASCHCKTSSLSLTVPTSSLPLPTHWCHCNTCRHTHGTLMTIHTPIPAPKVDLSTFTTYATSTRVKRYFCSTCGAHMLDCAVDEGVEKWYIATSLVDAPEETWKFHGHFWLTSTRDGGLAEWVREISRSKMRMWKEGTVHEPEYADKGDWTGPVPTTTQSQTIGALKETADKLKAQCHCGGVEFYISRPKNEESFKDIPESTTPKDKSKWYALNDVCTSCRLVSGCAIVSWMFPSLSNITLSDNAPYQPMFGTLKSYKSSPGVTRTFCGTCGAVVTFACDDRPDTIDVAVGLLRAESGVRAEDWLEWRTKGVAFGEDCEWKGVLDSLLRGLTRWEKEEGAGVR